MIHPTAVISPKAKLDPTVEVGPYAVIDAEVELGAHCIVGPHVHLTGVTTIGAHNRFHTGCVIGDAPQDLKYDGAPTRVRIGEHNVFREHTTVHRATRPDGETVIGSHCLLMASAHVGHNSVVGNHVILANGALLGGHTEIGDRAFLSGTCLVHQFVRVGAVALMQGGAAASKDVPPGTVVNRVNELVGLNAVGLRRAGFTSPQRLELKQIYHALFRSGKNFRSAVLEAYGKFSSPTARMFLDFCRDTKRGVCVDSGGRHSGEDAED